VGLLGAFRYAERLKTLDADMRQRELAHLLLDSVQKKNGIPSDVFFVAIERYGW